MLKVGYLVPFMVLKVLPDYDSFLVTLINKGILAQLPRKYALRQYRIGETGWAAIFTLKGARIALSQKSPQYVRKILEYLLSPLIQDEKIMFKKVARVTDAHFLKIAVEVPGDIPVKDIVYMCRPYLKETVKDYLSEQVIFVKYSRDIRTYIMNALAPAPGDKIHKVIHFKDIDEATVYVDDPYVGMFLGTKAKNAATASKLTGISITIKGC